MRCDRRFFVSGLATLPFATTISERPALAQQLSGKPITIMLGFAAGGGIDPVARVVADHLAKAFSRPVVLEFRPGANGMIAANVVAKAAPDGSTLLMTSPSSLINPKFRAGATYDPDKELVPISQITAAPFFLVANAKLPAQNFKELIAYAKANPGKINAGVSGFGGRGHLAMTLLQEVAGVKFNLVPYTGVGRLLGDLIGGQIDLACGIGTSGYLPGLEDKTLRGMVTMGSERLEDAPDVPTVVEQGYPDAQFAGWFMLAGPKAMPQDLVNSINSSVNEFLKTDEALRRLKLIGQLPKGTTPKGAEDIIVRDREITARMIAAGFQVE